MEQAIANLINTISAFIGPFAIVLIAILGLSALIFFVMFIAAIIITIKG